MRCSDLLAGFSFRGLRSHPFVGHCDFVTYTVAALQRAAKNRADLMRQCSRNAFCCTRSGIVAHVVGKGQATVYHEVHKSREPKATPDEEQ